MDRTEGAGEMLARILRQSHLVAFDQLPRLVADHTGALAMEDVRIFLADLRQTVLREVTGRGLDAGEGGETFAIDGTLPGRAYTSVQAQSAPEGSARRWWLPILDGTERLGVLRVGLPGDGEPDAWVHALASLVGLLLVSKRPSSDAYARLLRTEAMNVAAEMEWNLIPPRSFANRDVVISAAMEPAYTIGGDAFDYAVAGRRAHVAVFDAMGHDSHAGLMANLAVAACRNHRRQGADLVTTADRIEDELLDHFGPDRYVTAILADLDTETGLFSWISRGHVPPILLRGGRWTTSLECPPGHPLGAAIGVPGTVCHEQLEPGDRVLFYTDGVTEARDRTGRHFGVSMFTEFIIRQHAGGLSVAETLRRLVQAILNHHDGQLGDDATVVCLEWHGPDRTVNLRPDEGHRAP